MTEFDEMMKKKGRTRRFPVVKKKTKSPEQIAWEDSLPRSFMDPIQQTPSPDWLERKRHIDSSPNVVDFTAVRVRRIIRKKLSEF